MVGYLQQNQSPTTTTGSSSDKAPYDKYFFEREKECRRVDEDYKADQKVKNTTTPMPNQNKTKPKENQ